MKQDIEVHRYETPCCRIKMFDRGGVRSFFWDMRRNKHCPLCGRKRKDDKKGFGVGLLAVVVGA